MSEHSGARWRPLWPPHYVIEGLPEGLRGTMPLWPGTDVQNVSPIQVLCSDGDEADWQRMVPPYPRY